MAGMYKMSPVRQQRETIRPVSMKLTMNGRMVRLAILE